MKNLYQYFVQWITTGVQYLVILMEAMAAAPLWEMAHGQDRGRLFHVFFMPLVMIFCFVVAAAILWLSSGILHDIFFHGSNPTFHTLKVLN